jgi:hypothetical protein
VSPIFAMLHGNGKVTVENEGCLVTFDRDVPRKAVSPAESEQVVVLR